jgi:hypothetical protein
MKHTGSAFKATPFLLLALGTLLAAGPFACREKTDKDLILGLMDRIATKVEDRDTEALLARLTDDYSDHEGRDKDRTADLLADYFARYRGIVVHVLGTRIDSLDASQASIRTEVALSSGTAQVLRKLLRISTESYRFGLTLVKDGTEWKIRSAEWQSVGPDEIWPESAGLFKRLFPGY